MCSRLDPNPFTPTHTAKQLNLKQLQSRNHRPPGDAGSEEHLKRKKEGSTTFTMDKRQPRNSVIVSHDTWKEHAHTPTQKEHILSNFAAFTHQSCARGATTRSNNLGNAKNV